MTINSVKTITAPVSLDCGEVVARETETSTILLENNGNNPVTITGMLFSLPEFTCTESLPIMVPAFGTLSLDITFSPVRGGYISGDLTIINDSHNNPELTITLQGRGLNTPQLRLSPPELHVVLGPEEGQTTSFTIENTGDLDLVVDVTPETTPGWFSITNTHGTLSHLGLLVPEITLSSNNLIAGDYTINLMITHNDPLRTSPSSYPVTMTVEAHGRLRIDTVTLAFGDVEVGSSEVLSFTATNSGNSPVQITSLDFSEPDFSCAVSLPLDVPAYGSSVIEVIYVPLTGGAKQGTLSIISDAEDNPLLSVTLSGQAHLPPELVPGTTSIQAISIGGENPTQTLSLTNTSDHPLSITVTDDADWLTIQPVDINLAAQSSVAPDLLFTAEGLPLGEHAGVISITHNGASPITIECSFVLNTPPVAEFSWLPDPPYSEGTIHFDGGLSSDPDGTIQAYLWDFDGDGEYDDAVGLQAATSFPEGNYTIGLQVADNYGTTNSITHDLEVLPGMSLPYFEGFEDTPGEEWTFSSTGPGRIRVSTDNAPYAGSYHVLMDCSTNGTNSLNELILSLNLAGKSGLTLIFHQKEFGDEAHTLPASFTGSANGDGVAVSSDGETWHTIYNLTNGLSSWSRIEVDLDSAIRTAGIAYSSTFFIKFCQYDNYSISTDGMAIDDIWIYSSNENVPPVVAITAKKTSEYAGIPVQLSGTDSTDLDGTIESWLRDVNHDGIYDDASGETIAVTYQEPGNYSVGLKVIDSSGGFGFDSIDLEFISSPVFLLREDFEDDLTSEWSQSSTGNGRVIFSTSGPYEGSRMMFMDTSPPGTYSRNEAIVTLDMSGQSNVTLTFRVKETGDEDNNLPPSFTGSYNGDGVCFSIDGQTWHTLLTFTGTNCTSTWQEHSIDLDLAVANAGLSYTSTFMIKFQQYDNYVMGSDGIGIDLVEISCPGTGE